MIHLLYTFNLILLLYFITLLFKACFKKSTDINQYKILNGHLSAIIILGYLSLLVIGLYIYRLFRVGNTLDLKLLFNNCNYFFISDIPIILKIIFILHGILIMLLFMLIILNIHKYATLEIFKVYIFINYGLFLWKNKYTKPLYNFLTGIARETIISFI